MTVSRIKYPVSLRCSKLEPGSIFLYLGDKVVLSRRTVGPRVVELVARPWRIDDDGDLDMDDSRNPEVVITVPADVCFTVLE